MSYLEEIITYIEKANPDFDENERHYLNVVLICEYVSLALNVIFIIGLTWVAHKVMTLTRCKNNKMTLLFSFMILCILSDSILTIYIIVDTNRRYALREKGNFYIMDFLLTSILE